MTAEDIAVILNTPTRTVRHWAKQEDWEYVQEELDHGVIVRKYMVGILPEQRKQALEKQLIVKEVTENLPAKADDTQPLTALKGWQRDVMDARLQFVRYLDGLVRAHKGVNKAVAAVLSDLRSGAIDQKIMEVIQRANARPGKKARTLSRATIFRWRKWQKMVDKGQATIAIFAPKDPEKKEAPLWSQAFLACYRVPSKPSIPHAMEKMRPLLPVGVEMPSLDQVRRFANKMSKAELQKGRSTGAELRHYKPFRRRKKDDMPPLTVGELDGHTCKFRVQNPESGNPFKPEICGIICVSTRYYCGVGFGLAESAHTVADAVRDAATIRDYKPYGGVFDIIHADNGAGNTAHQNTDELFGLFPRIGTTFKPGRPGNPMGQGAIERTQASLWIRAGKELPAFTGKKMDSGAARKFDLALQADIKANGKSDMVMSWPQFQEWAKQTIQDYNNRPNSALPRVTDPETGKRRHATPTEAVEAWIAAGWDITKHQLSPGELEILFRPRVVRVVRNGEVQFGNKIYYHDILANYHGKKVQLAYELQNMDTVQVWDEQDRLICYALLDGNRIGYYPETEKQRAADKRAKRRSDIKKAQLEEIEAERRGVVDLESAIAQEARKLENQQPLMQPAPVIQKKEVKEPEAQQPPPSAGWKVPDDPVQRYAAWKELDRLVSSGMTLEDREQAFYDAYQKSPAYKAFAAADEL